MMLILRRYITALTILIGFAYPVVAQSDLGKKLKTFDEVIAKAKAEKNDTLLANALYTKVALFYNQAGR